MTPPLKLEPMETIHELNSPTRHRHASPGMPGAAAEAMMFSVRSNSSPSGGESGSLRAATGRSASMKLPVARKASFRVREWMRRSNTTSNSRSTETATTSTVPRPKITHLGGGRISEDRVEYATPQGQAPAGRQVQRSRAGSADSRRTQWLDFYSDDLPTARFPPATQAAAQPQPSLTRSSTTTQLPHAKPVSGSTASSSPSPSPSRPPRPHPRPEPPHPDIELRPLPLRVPSLERERNPDASASQPSGSKPLVRKNSKWKALPNLPAPPAVHPVAEPTKAEPSEPTAASAAATEAKAAEVEDVEQLMGKIMLDAEPAERQLPVLQASKYQPAPSHDLGTPPPTPDSSAGGAAAAPLHISRTRPCMPPPSPSSSTTASALSPAGSGPHHHTPAAAPPPIIGPSSPASQRPGPPKFPQRTHSLRHTRQERTWLHANYRGEAPFLRAWGLDIARQKDREEGLALVRELMLEDHLAMSPPLPRGRERSAGRGGVSHSPSLSQGGRMAKPIAGGRGD